MDAGGTVQGHGQGQQELHVAPAAAGAAHGHGGFAAGQQHAGRRHRLAMAPDLQGDGGHHLAHVAGLALDAVAQQHGGDAGGAGHLGGGLQGHLGGGDQVGEHPGEARVAGFHRFAAATLQQGPGAGRQIDGVAADDGQGVGAGGGIGHGGAGGDVHGVVAGHVGDQQIDHPGRVAGCRQAPALDGREVAAHAVHLRDGGAGLEQGPVDGLLVLQADALAGQGQQGRATAGDQADDQIIGAEALHQGQHARGGFAAGGVGHRVGSLDDLDALAGHGVAVTGDDQARQLTRPVLLQRPGHGRRGLAGPDHQGAALGRRRQEAGDAVLRLGGIHRRGEEGLEQIAGRGVGHGRSCCWREEVE